jgi:hypothetical protein
MFLFLRMRPANWALFLGIGALITAAFAQPDQASGPERLGFLAFGLIAVSFGVGYWIREFREDGRIWKEYQREQEILASPVGPLYAEATRLERQQRAENLAALERLGEAMRQRESAEKSS